MSYLDRAELVVGADNMERIKQSTVAVVGCGGVGGYVVEMLARSGVGTLILVDYDRIDITNINRQIIALHSNIGENKVDMFKSRIADISPHTNVVTLAVRYTAENRDLLDGYHPDYIVDCIDSVADKVELACYAKESHTAIISAMGAGNRSGNQGVEIKDIYATSYDRLARAFRRKLRERGISDLKVACCVEQPVARSGAVGSLAHVVAAMGVAIAGEVYNDIIGAGK